MVAYCKKCRTKMDLIEVDERQEWAWKIFRCPNCGREVKEKFDKEEIEL